MKGHTLLEVLLALFLMALLIEGARGGLVRFNNAHLVKREAKLLLERVRYESLLAQASGSSRSIEFREKDRVAAVIRTDPGKGRRTVRTYPLARNIEFSEIRFGELGKNANLLTFYPSGVATPGRLTLKSRAGAHCTIVQSLRGWGRLTC